MQVLLAGLRVDVTNPLPQVLLQPKVTQATQPGPRLGTPAQSAQQSNQRFWSPSGGCGRTRPGPWCAGARTCGTGPAAAGTRP